MVRPLKFESVESLQDAIAQFKAYINDNKKPMTIERLCCFLGCDRKTLVNYTNKDEFFHTIKEIKDEIYAEKFENALLGETNTAFTIFDLVNNGNYVNRQDNHNTNQNRNYNYDNLSKEQIKEIDDYLDGLIKD